MNKETIVIGSILIGFLTALLYCALVIFVAFLFVWGLRFVGVNIDGNVYKWGKVIVGLICVIILLSWLLSALGVASNRSFRVLGSSGDGHHTPASVHLSRMLT